MTRIARMLRLCAELVLGVRGVPRHNRVPKHTLQRGNCAVTARAYRERASQPKVRCAVGEGGKFVYEFERGERVRCGPALGAWGGAGLLSAPTRATTR